MNTGTLLIYLGIFAVFIYFGMIRPGRKRMEEQRLTMNSLTPGTRVMLNTGFFGTVTAIGVNQLVIEFAPGVDVTVLKQAVSKILGPDDEEFEYSDDDLSDADIDDLSDADIDDDSVYDPEDDLVVTAPLGDLESPDWPEGTDPTDAPPAVRL